MRVAETARGDKYKYTDKQKRQAEHIEEGRNAETHAATVATSPLRV